MLMSHYHLYHCFSLFFPTFLPSGVGSYGSYGTGYSLATGTHPMPTYMMQPLSYGCSPSQVPVQVLQTPMYAAVDPYSPSYSPAYSAAYCSSPTAYYSPSSYSPAHYQTA